MKNRLKNYGLWISIFALVMYITNFCGFTVVTEFLGGLKEPLLIVIIALGLINNPDTDKRSYLDDPKG